MALLDVFKRKARTLEDWSPEIPWSDVDVAALIADLRRTHVPALDDIIIGVIDGPGGQDWLQAREQAAQVVVALSDADKMRLFGRATLIEAATQFLYGCFSRSEDHASRFHNVYAWEKLIGAAIYVSCRAVVKLDDLATLDIVRAARCRLRQGSTHALRDLVGTLVEKVPEPMSAVQRGALVELAELLDKATWKTPAYREALQSIEPLFARIGRPNTESYIFIKNEQLKKIADTALEYACEGASPPLKTVIRGIVEDD
ncbi:MAG TPA: hypothetical protein VGH49_16745, partial [Xanthobacteraceae bacterium]